MSALAYTDHRKDPAAWARALRISTEAAELYLASEVLDLHLDTFIWHRIFGYDLHARHDEGPLAASFYSQVDLPRVREAHLTGGIWVITTNPLRTAAGRARAFVENVYRLKDELERASDDVAVVRNVREFRAAREKGLHAAFLGIQGGNALDEREDSLELIPEDLIVRITLVHLSSSRIGVTSSPLALGKERGLTDFGKGYVQRMNAKKILVDLAHISREGFFDAVRAHDKSQPLIVTHTGVTGVTPHWRNLDDDQLRAIADTGGTIGVMFQSSFLGDPNWSGRAVSIVRHLAHIVDTVGEDHASLGSDFDGAIVPPRDLRTVEALPRLVHLMLERGWSAERIQKILAGNALRTIEMLRG